MMLEQIPLDSLDASWRFSLEDIPPEQVSSPEYDDSSWERVTLPHTVKIEPPLIQKGGVWTGACWYRLPIFMKEDWNDRIIHLEIDGAMQKSEIYVNGKYLFTHLGGYQRFLIPLTQKLEAGKTNIVAIRLDNTPTDDVPPGQPPDSLDFCYYGGIYRSARLTVREKLHITDPLEVNIEAGGGVFIRTLKASKKSASLDCGVHVIHQILRGEVWNLPQKADIPYPCKLKIELFAPNGKRALPPVTLQESIRPNMDHTFSTLLEVKNPLLWSPDTPLRYTFRFTLSSAEKGVLEVKTLPFGIRTFDFTRKHGWRINGKKTPIIGTNRHQEYPQIGNAAPATLQKRDAMMIKKGGYNLVRLAHYVQSPAFLDACDELGICVMAPISGWQYCSYNSTFVNNVLRDCRELVRTERNRPSVMLWEVSLNETYPNAWLQEEMHRIAHREYPGKQCFTCGDVYGLFEGWDVLFNRTKLNNQEKPVIVREYGDWAFGGGKSTSRRTRKDGEYDLLRQTWNYQWSLNRMPTEPGYIGGCTWCMFDYNNGFRGIPCECGDGDLYRVPKYKYYFYMSQGAREPMVYCATQRDKILDKVVVFSNCDEVELILNGKSLARRKPDGGGSTSYHLTGNPNWETVLRPWELDGMAVEIFNGGNCENLAHPPFTFTGLPEEKGELRAIGYCKGKAVAEHVVRTPGKAERLSIDVRSEGVPFVENDIALVHVSVLDGNATVVPDGEHPVTLASVRGCSVIGEKTRAAEAGIAGFVIRIENPLDFSLSASAEGVSGALI